MEMEMEQMQKTGNGKEAAKEEIFLPPVHIQVRKIKQESENWSLDVPEVRPVATRRLARSPLGPAGQPISVGN